MDPQGLIEKYRQSRLALTKWRDLQFPTGLVVSVAAPRYTGPGVTADSTEREPDKVAVQLGNGNVWDYPIECVKVIQ